MLTHCQIIKNLNLPQNKEIRYAVLLRRVCGEKQTGEFRSKSTFRPYVTISVFQHPALLFVYCEVVINKLRQYVCKHKSVILLLYGNSQVKIPRSAAYGTGFDVCFCFARTK